MSGLPEVDSVPLDAYQSDDPASGEAAAGKKREPRLRVANLKLLVALFIIFITVVSSAFTNSVLSGFGEKAVKGRSPTSWGVVLQGVFVVLFYILAVYLTEHGIL